MDHHKYYNKYIKYKKKYKIEGGAGNDNVIHDMCDNCDVHQSYENFSTKICFNNLRDDCCGIQRNSQECREWVSYTVNIKSQKTDMDKKDAAFCLCESQELQKMTHIFVDAF